MHKYSHIDATDTSGPTKMKDKIRLRVFFVSLLPYRTAPIREEVKGKERARGGVSPIHTQDHIPVPVLCHVPAQPGGATALGPDTGTEGLGHASDPDHSIAGPAPGMDVNLLMDRLTYAHKF